MESLIGPIASGVISAMLAAFGCYVADASITGHEWNDDTRTVGNVTDNNGAHVLLAVIGV